MCLLLRLCVLNGVLLRIRRCCRFIVALPYKLLVVLLVHRIVHDRGRCCCGGSCCSCCLGGILLCIGSSCIFWVTLSDELLNILFSGIELSVTVTSRTGCEVLDCVIATCAALSEEDKC